MPDFNTPNLLGITKGRNSNILFGSGAPLNSLGVNGDLYLDVLNNNIYMKEAGVWVLKYSARDVAFESLYTDYII